MRTKKAKTSPRGIQYLLKADRKLRKLSLRRVSQSRPAAGSARRTTRTKTTAPRRQSVAASKPASAKISARARGFIAIAVVATAALLVARPAPRARSASVDATASAAAPAHVEPSGGVSPQSHVGANVVTSSRPARETRISSSTTATGEARPTRSLMPSKAPATSSVFAAPDARMNSAITPASPGKLPTSNATKALGSANEPGENLSKAATATEQRVTITGCLERQNGTFRLKDTSGADAPKVRGWKGGFLKRRSATIDLLDPADRLRLGDSVGQRIAASGILSEHEMRVSSWQRVSASCK